MSDIKKQLIELTPNKIFSIDTRGKPMTQNTFYNQISKNMKLGNNLVKVATIGFFKAGQLLNKAKDELGRDFGIAVARKLAASDVGRDGRKESNWGQCHWAEARLWRNGDQSSPRNAFGSISEIVRPWHSKSDTSVERIPWNTKSNTIGVAS